MSDDLKSCPFCNCKDVTTWFDREQGDKWGYASCDGCGARGPDVRTKYERGSDAPWHSEAIAAWNTRREFAPVVIHQVDEGRIEELEERNKELTLQLLATHGQAADALDRAVVAEAKLTNALKHLKTMADWNEYVSAPLLAELEGKE